MHLPGEADALDAPVADLGQDRAHRLHQAAPPLRRILLGPEGPRRGQRILRCRRGQDGPLPGDDDGLAAGGAEVDAQDGHGGILQQ